MSLLRLDQVSKIYQFGGIPVKALENATLEIKKGEFTAIMGPSGSGKSTLMHIAGCLDTPTHGQVFLNNQDISNLSEKELAQIRNKQIGFVFQNFNLIPRISALENVSLPLLYSGIKTQERLKRAKAALKMVGLDKREQHFPNQLSGGEQQRIAIARALINNPQILFADEPTGNLDTKSGQDIMKILISLNQKGHTIVIVTHDPKIAKYAQRIIKIIDGKIVN